MRSECCASCRERDAAARASAGRELCDLGFTQWTLDRARLEAATTSVPSRVGYQAAGFARGTLNRAPPTIPHGACCEPNLPSRTERYEPKAGGAPIRDC